MTASAARHFALPPTPISLRFSRCPPGPTPPDLPPRSPTPPSEISVALPPTGRISTRTHHRTAAAAGAAHPAVDHGFGPGSVLRMSSSRINPPPHVSRPWLPSAAAPSVSRAPTPVPTVPNTSDRDRAEPLSFSLLGVSTSPESPSDPAVDLDALGAADELHFGYSAARYSHVDCERDQLPELTCYAAIQCILIGRPLALLIEILAGSPHISGPISRRCRRSLSKAASIPPTRVLYPSCVIKLRPTTPYGPRDAKVAF